MSIIALFYFIVGINSKCVVGSLVNVDEKNDTIVYHVCR